MIVISMVINRIIKVIMRMITMITIIDNVDDNSSNDDNDNIYVDNYNDNDKRKVILMITIICSGSISGSPTKFNSIW